MLARRPLSALSIILFMSLQGCASEHPFLPPSENEYVTVTVKVPLGFEAETMQVMYRSEICKQPSYDGNGNRNDVQGYHALEVQPVRKGGTDLYEARLARLGGGRCNWNLSNVTFGIAYTQKDFLGESVSYGAGGGVVVVFDNNSSQRGGAGRKVNGDLVLVKNFYPWISERFIGGYQKKINFVGENIPYLEYQAIQSRSVYFEPIVHSAYVLRSVAPKVKEKGVYTTYTYPDGSAYSDGKWPPSFNRLEAIRLAAEARK